MIEVAAKKNITTTKRKKKVWYGLYAPSTLNNAFIGETHAYSPESIIGKTVSMNLAMIINDMKKQNINVSFKVKEVKDNKGVTELIGYSLILAHLKRLVRRKRDKIDDSFLATAKDGKIIRVKTVAMTNSKTYDSVSNAVRLSLRAKIKKALKEMTFDEFISSLINVRLQRDWKTSLNKIYPIKFLEVRHASIEVPKKKLKDEDYKDFTELVKDEDEDIEYSSEESLDESSDAKASDESESDEEVKEESDKESEESAQDSKKQ